MKYVMPQYKLRNVISETVFSVAVNDQRAAFNGAFFQIKEGNLVVVGCDGQRLAAAKVRIGEDIEETSFIVPKKFLTELVRMLEDSEEEVTMMVGAKHVIFRFRNMYFFTRLIEAEYINFEKLLPKSYMTQAYVSKADFIAALERAAIVADEKTGGSSKSHVKLEFENNSIRMSALSQDGSVNEKVPAAIDGQDLAIGFNCRFLLESLKSTPNECDRIRIRMNTPLMGAIIEPAEGSSINETNPDSSVYGNRENRQNKVEDEEKGTFTYFVMPIKMNR
jgi:DNA polymerase-3 subunit beta